MRVKLTEKYRPKTLTDVVGQGMEYCQICDWWEERAWGDGCRHVKWTDGIGRCGCGSTETEWSDHRESFLVLLGGLAPLTYEKWVRRKFVHRPLLPKLRALIRANDFWATWHGSILGPADLDLRHSFGPDRAWTLRDIRSSEMEAWGLDAIDASQLGMAWLTSLDDKAVKPNRLTVKWIDEFLKEAAK